MAILLLASPVFSQIVSITDTAFLYALIEEGVDTDKDSLISYEEAEAIISLGLDVPTCFCGSCLEIPVKVSTSYRVKVSTPFQGNVST